MAFTGAKKRSIYEIQINQCTFFWRCNSGNVDFFHCDGGDGTLVVWGVICLIGLLSRPLSLPWWWLWGSHSNALDGMKCVFITKNKYFFFCKKKYFFLQKEVLFFGKKKYFSSCASGYYQDRCHLMKCFLVVVSFKFQESHVPRWDFVFPETIFIESSWTNKMSFISQQTQIKTCKKK